MHEQPTTRFWGGPSALRRVTAPAHRVGARLLATALACLTLASSVACEHSKEQSRETEQRAVSYLTPRYLAEAIDGLFQPLPKPIRALSLTAIHGVVVAQVQDHTDLTRVVEYRYSNGTITGPNPVALSGPGKLTENLFPLAAVDPHVAEGVLNTVRNERSEPVRKLVLARNLPHSMDIQFRVFLQTPKGDQVITADKAGRLLGPLTSDPTASNSELPRTP